MKIRLTYHHDSINHVEELILFESVFLFAGFHKCLKLSNTKIREWVDKASLFQDIAPKFMSDQNKRIVLVLRISELTPF